MESRRPLVSVIMNCLDGEAYLREAIESVFAQTYPDWEIVFFDNASTDSSAAIARSYGDKVRYFRSEKTIPLGAARNAAIAAARGDLIAFLDTDDYWLPQKLEWQVAAMAGDSDLSLAYSNFYFLNGKSGRKHLGYRSPQPTGDVFAAFLRYYPVNLQTVMIRSAALAKMPSLFDPALDVSEEYDLFIRLLHKTKACYSPQATAVYRVHDKMASVLRNDRYPVENEYILRKLRSSIADLDRLYPAEVRYLEAKIGYWYAVAHMAKDDRLSARRCLARHKGVAPAFLLLFLVTYLPSAAWRAILDLKAALRWR